MTRWNSRLGAATRGPLATRRSSDTFRTVALGAASSLLLALAVAAAGLSPTSAADPATDDALLQQLDAPLLFVARHSYTGIHIYDVFYKWPPGGGGIYVLENPAAPRAQWQIRAVIDPTTAETLGVGVHSDPALSWDARRLLFCFKGEPEGSTSIYEIGIDGTGLRRITDPGTHLDRYRGSFAGQHDVAPDYLPDGRIVFLSTRPSGLVPCFNSGVAILHVMNADGTDIHPISVNNVNEFDPTVLPDGRLLFGRWEYIDKNALTIQSLWTVNPDGTQETALYANNMVFPEAILDARPVPGTPFVVGTLAKHNGPPRGSIGLIDPRSGKNDPRAILNLEHPEEPTYDRGESCEPWPVTEELFLFSGRPPGHDRNVLELIDRSGRRVVVHSDPQICLHSPMLIKPRAVPPAIADTIDRTATTGRFFLQDIYRGLPGVEPGSVKWLRVIEETSRTSPRPAGANPYNQTFLVSCALAFSAKNVLGVVPVDADGSAYFEVPSGRALYLQALDADGRLVQSMRTFVQAAPGTTRSCIGCHEHKFSTTAASVDTPGLAGREPSLLQPESWGSGYLDYASRVQPVLDRRCVRCHGGTEGIGGGMDLSGGWTEHFNISYENLTSRRENQLVAYWISGIDCMNGTAFWSSQIFPPRGHGSGNAPLADLLVAGHDGQIGDLTRAERDLLMAWIDSNGLYHGTWDYTEHGCALPDWTSARDALISEMQSAGCLECHGDGRQAAFFESDWFNLQSPELSRILRAPLPEGAAGCGLGWCRDRRVDPARQRVRLLWNGYAHAVQPLEAFPRHAIVPPDRSGQPVTHFASTSDPHYQAMLAIIRDARVRALARPRIDMPGAQPVAGSCRLLVGPPLPSEAPPLSATIEADGSVRLHWELSAATIGLEAELHRSEQPDFSPQPDTWIARTWLGEFLDDQSPAGPQHYALLLRDGDRASAPSRVTVNVPPPIPPAAPDELEVLPASAAVRLGWNPPPGTVAGYHVFRASPGEPPQQLTDRPVAATTFLDAGVEPDRPYRYEVRAVSRRGAIGDAAGPVEAVARVIHEPVFVARLDGKPRGELVDGGFLAGVLAGRASLAGGELDLSSGGHLTFPHRAEFDLSQPLSLCCRVWFDRRTQMPVVASCGQWNQAGWFLQWLGDRWRWHVGGVDCDGGQPSVGRWIHVVGVYDGQAARLYQDGVLVAEVASRIHSHPWPGALHVGQYSGGPSPEFQVEGRITDLRLYHRPLADEEIAAMAREARPGSRDSK